MKEYRLESTPGVELDVEAAFEWYEGEEFRLGFEFLDELRDAYVRILNHPLAYHGFSISHLRSSHLLIDLGNHGLTAAAIKYRSFGPCAIRNCRAH